MGDWNRSTRECPIESLSPEMASAIHKHVEQYNLGPILSEALLCVETRSDRIRKGLFGGGEVVMTGAVVTPAWLIWAISGAKAGATVMSARLAEVVIQDYAMTQMGRMVPDTGVEVSGSFTDVHERASAFIGLDDGSAGRKFKEVVLKALQEAKK